MSPPYRVGRCAPDACTDDNRKGIHRGGMSPFLVNFPSDGLFLAESSARAQGSGSASSLL